ncbi:YbhB/YbcL family Raf kinase inhibitor-like protein [Pacificimonas sp. ICDLI1SI03]
MLEHIPHWLGSALGNVRAGHNKLTIVQEDMELGDVDIELSSPAFAMNQPMPLRYTADGEGISPPLSWEHVPPGTQSLALIVEDADSPSPQPLVHAIYWNLPSSERYLAEGAIREDGRGSLDGRDVGRNSYLVEGWLPPDPPTGHGPHDYVFQLFALKDTPDLGETPGRSAFVSAIKGRILGAGILVGTYERGAKERVSSDVATMAPA